MLQPLYLVGVTEERLFEKVHRERTEGTRSMLQTWLGRKEKLSQGEWWREQEGGL